jgi:hypothetical protein
MRRLFLVFFIVITGFSFQACNDNSKTKSETKDEAITEADVPASVKTTFTAKYPSATDIRWENAHENNKQTYKAKFSLNGKNFKAEFDDAGTFIKEKEDK